MLDVKMSSSLSPMTPLNIPLSAECYGMWENELMNPTPMKLESSDFLDLIDPNINGHQISSRDSGYSSHYNLTQIGGLGDPYNSSECQTMENFHCGGNVETSYPKYTNYDFIPDLGSDSVGLGSLGSSIQFQLNDPLVPHINSSHHEYNWDELPCDCEPGDFLFLRKEESPLSSEMDSKSSGESLSALTDICHESPPKRRVGRPPKKDKKLKRNEKKTGRLWEFIRDLLKNPDYCPSLVRWENPDEGHFRFVNSEKVAQLWGHIKGNPRMTYEKLSRAMRYYYKSHVFEPVLGRRLVYKFGHNATNWRPVNPNFNTFQQQKIYN